MLQSFSAVKSDADDGLPLRRVPASLEAERALLGAILLNNAALDRVSDRLSPEHFFSALHEEIYKSIVTLVGRGQNANPITLKGQFEGRSLDPDTTIAQYLFMLPARAVTTINVRDYADVIVEMSRRRALITIGQEMVDAAYDSGIDFDANHQIEDVERQLTLVSAPKLHSEFLSYGTTVDAVVRDAADAYRMGGRPAGFSTGLADLDAKLGGLQPGLIVIGARPSMGKTALATGIAVHVARHGERITPDGEIIRGASVAFFSLEMSREQVSARILASDAGIPASRIKSGNLTEGEIATVLRAAETGKTTPLKIDDTGGLTLSQVSARARRLKRSKDGLDLIVIDYLQIMSGSRQGRGDNRVFEIQQLTSGLKALSKELGIPIILLSQLSRDLEKRADKRPQLSDLRESGAIEQDADVVMFVYRDEYYVEREEPPSTDVQKYLDWQSKMRDCAGVAEVIIGKQRDGNVGTVRCAFEPSLTRFSNLAVLR